jgi:hypothetical protein
MKLRNKRLISFNSLLIVFELQNEENKAMYQKLFEQYDMDRDGFITMDENLEQDKVMADEQGKPFDEVRRILQKLILALAPARRYSLKLLSGAFTEIL